MARKMLIDGDLEKNNEVESHYDFDLFVIGAGSGGVRASRFSAQSGAKVGICELPFHPISSEVIGGVGGTCVIRGCVPKKILVYGASYGLELEDARNYGWELNERIDFNWKKLLYKKTEEIVRLNGIYKRLLANAGVKQFEGEGRVVGPNEVEVIQLDGTKINYSAKHILITTGSRAQRPPIPGQELAITSDEALSLEELPKRAVVLGGGYIAVEFASIWRGMGATVDLCFRKELPLRGFDDEMRAVVARNLEGRGINLHPRTTLTELVKTEDGIKVHTDHGEEIVADVVLFATGNLKSPASYALVISIYRDKQKNFHMVFIDLEKVYDRVPRDILWKVLEKKGVCVAYIEAINDMYNGVLASVNTHGGESKEFPITIGLHQVSALSPYLFALVMDELTGHVQDDVPWCMLFVDDIVLVDETKASVNAKLEVWRGALENK